jgi:hypothetical protein
MLSMWTAAAQRRADSKVVLYAHGGEDEERLRVIFSVIAHSSTSAFREAEKVLA